MIRDETTNEKEVSFVMENNVVMIKRWVLMLVAAALMAAMVALPASPASAKEANFGKNASGVAKSSDTGKPSVKEEGHGYVQSGYALFHGPHGDYDPNPGKGK